ncbi:hypothetical protein B0H12DRAFT_1107635, partial [Mycena haematopus]
MFSGDGINQELLVVDFESGLRDVEEGEGAAAVRASLSAVREGYSGLLRRVAQKVCQFLRIGGWGLDGRGVCKCSGHLGVEYVLGNDLVGVDGSHMGCK